MAPERRPYQGGLLIRFFSEPDLAAGCGVIARAERFQPRQDCRLQDFTVFVRAHRRLGGEPLRTAYAVAEPNQYRAIALFKLRPDPTADEQVEAVVELSQSALDSLGLKPGMIKPL